MDNQNTAKSANSDDLSILDILNKIKSGFYFLRTKWMILSIGSLIGCGIGFTFSLLKKTVYTAVSTFVLEEGASSSGISQYTGLASLAGIDIGGNSGIFQADNIIELYKSRLMIEKALLTEVNTGGKPRKLIDWYLSKHQIKDSELSNIDFNGSPEKFNRKQDSIITNLVAHFNKKLLTVYKPDKKLSIIAVQVVDDDELFVKEFTSTLVETVNSFYIQTKTKNLLQNVLILQRQSDSIRKSLNFSINGVASASDATPNANPALSTLRVSSQKKQIDVQTNSSVYSELVKNLEASKIVLRQQTPLIQIIERPVLPLSAYHIGKLKASLIGFVLFFILTSILLIGRKMISKANGATY